MVQIKITGPPEPPAGTPSVSAASPTSVYVTWSTPTFDGGHKLAGYIVEMSTGRDGEWNEVVRTSDSLNAHVSVLEADVTYRFRVRAVNIHGSSEPSGASDPIMLNKHSNGSCTSSLPSFTGIESGDDFKDRYLTQEELGKGRYGVVHRVTCQRTGQVLAAKVIRCIKLADKEKAREEIDIMNSLRHPKLLQLVAAFESPREMVMLMEYISGGELFERVVADDFQLTERDCILFMKQICEGVAYMDGQSVVHLDLKPENIMCQTRTSHQIKLIDFGLAQRLDPNTPVRVLFGTPEFVPPEIINYEPIGIQSDMWSVGVVCYVLLSGLSPFMGSNDAETFANVTRADYDFDDEAFDAISDDAKQFISSLLIRRKEKRLTADECLTHKWMLSEHEHSHDVILSTDKLKKFINRRKWLKTANAIRALGRMANLSASSRRNSAASSGSCTSPRVSVTGSATTGKPDDSGRGRVCSERSDSGISDCSNLTTPSLTCEVIVEESDLTHQLNSLSQKILDLDRPDEEVKQIGMERISEENRVSEKLVEKCELVVDDVRIENKETEIVKNNSPIDVDRISSEEVKTNSYCQSIVEDSHDKAPIEISPKLNSTPNDRFPLSLRDPVAVSTRSKPEEDSSGKDSPKIISETVHSRESLDARLSLSSPSPVTAKNSFIPKVLSKNNGIKDVKTTRSSSIGSVNGSVCAAPTSSSGLSSKRAEFLRLQQKFAEKPASSPPCVGVAQPPRTNPSSENQPRSRTSPTFQKTIAFWQR